MTGTAAGGYLLLMAAVIAYYYGVARVAGDFITSAFTGTAMLIAIALPLWGGCLVADRTTPPPGRRRRWRTQRTRPIAPPRRAGTFCPSGRHTGA